MNNTRKQCCYFTLMWFYFSASFLIGVLVIGSMCFVACRRNQTRVNGFGFFQGNNKLIFDDEDEQLFSINKGRIIG